ncbi:hypothetical protein MKQ68_06130 [Chitinophaga horti]|uniref:PH domain-containing protein n=1 Tax=Chitinophaga horti TaxID=2920382 RepID=A0ABY6J5P0_9BACT|nr:hypothetical protein [Chitinophaga horti]UYQ94666.1 hypothetical protein MKQ68_06130 [Chitinophaga horti]
MKIFRWTICSLAILYALTATFAITKGQQLPYEFKDAHLRQEYYTNMIWLLPVAILATLVVTVRESFSSGKNTLILVGTLLIAALSVRMLLTQRSPLYANWVDVTVTYEKRDNREIRMAEQLLDVGALGFKGSREVKLSPFLGIFNKVEPVDIEQADKSGWVKVDRAGAVKHP